MATKKEINAYLKESGYSREDMKGFFDESKEVNWIIRNLSENGIKWSDLTIHQIKQLPGLKQRSIEKLKAADEEKKSKEEAKIKEQEAKKYYEEHFEEIILEKILKGEALTERELSELVFEYNIDEKQNDELRWTYLMESIIELRGRYFKIIWQKAKTEYQEHVFMDQPVEVTKSTKTVEVSVWS